MSGIDIEGTLSARWPAFPGEAFTASDGHTSVRMVSVEDVAAVLREQIEGAIIAATVGALQYAAGLASSLENDELAAQLYDAARNTEAQDPADWWCCPVCEEMTCDDGCPLEPIRAAHLSDTERAGGAE